MRHSTYFLLAVLFAPPAIGGPYSAAMGDNANAYDAPVPGFIGPEGVGKARLDDGEGNFQNPRNRVNPLFFSWADEITDYSRSDTDTGYSDPSYALGQLTGDLFDVVSLGDMTAAAISSGAAPGQITLRFNKPIRNLSGADFAIFENGFISNFNTGGAGIGGIFAELAYVEVSADGETFHRFNPASLTPASVGNYGTVNPTNIFNLAGKHTNASGNSWGTPFDIGQLGLNEIHYIRIVDIPGNGSFKDGDGRAIYDSWRTFGSGGFDLEAVGSISNLITYAEWPALQELPEGQRGGQDDPDGDGIPNLLEYAFSLVPWLPGSPAAGWDCQIEATGEGPRFAVTSLRDERLTDVLREVQVSTDLKSWQTIATSSAGASFLPSPAFSPQISDTVGSGIASVGVIRRDKVLDTRVLEGDEKRYYRLKVSLLTP